MKNYVRDTERLFEGDWFQYYNPVVVLGISKGLETETVLEISKLSKKFKVFDWITW